ncbi:hypothetical protein D3C78_1278910 [compost metagenome]
MRVAARFMIWPTNPVGNMKITRISVSPSRNCHRPGKYAADTSLTVSKPTAPRNAPAAWPAPPRIVMNTNSPERSHDPISGVTRPCIKARMAPEKPTTTADSR